MLCQARGDTEMSLAQCLSPGDPALCRREMVQNHEGQGDIVSVSGRAEEEVNSEGCQKG